MSSTSVSNKPLPPPTNTPVSAACIIDSLDSLDWTDSADVLVVGWGAAGASAALEARAGGADVLVIDRFNGGGASALSGGVVYAGGGTAQQQQAGYADSPSAMFDYLRHETQGVVRDETLQRFCDQSVANLSWLQSHGARFGSSMPKFKTSYPADGIFLYYSGNEAVPAYRGASDPAPRGHRTVSKGQSGAILYAALHDATRASGARCLTQSSVRRLVMLRTPGQPDRVVGAEVWRLPENHPKTLRHATCHRLANQWRNFWATKAEAWRREAYAIELELARPVFIQARQSVILASGGYVFNNAMVRQHAPKYARGWKIGTAACDGSGIQLGQSVGGQADRLNNISAWRFITPPYAWPKAIVVNTKGERFCNEQVYGATLGHAMVEEQGGKAWIVLDAKLRRAAIFECLFGGLWAFQSLPALMMMMIGSVKAGSVGALAKKIGADVATLEASVQNYNAAIQEGRTDVLGKSSDMCQALRTGPFYALNIAINSPVFPLAILSLGGLRVNEMTGQVQDAAGQDIAGLQAAGRTAIGIASHRYVSGLSLADCIFSGRRAGKAAALFGKQS